MKHISPGISTPIISSPTTSSLVILSPIEASDSITLAGSLTISGSILPSGSLLIDGDVNITGDAIFDTPPIFLNPNISVTSSYAVSSSYINPTFISASAAASGFGTSGVTQIIAGSNITISPTSGTGSVTISSTGGGGGVSRGFVIAMATAL